MTVLSSTEIIVPAETQVSGVSWSAIFAGALATTALSLILLVLGSGLGLAMVSPWTAAGVGATTFAVSTAIWLVITQWVSAGVGGYLAGRLRTKWSGVDTDEVCFRDTAHGFFAWSLSTLLVAGLLSSAVATAVGGGVSAVSAVASGATQAATTAAATSAATNGSSMSMPTDYLVDMFFRPAEGVSTGVTENTNVTDSKSEASRILISSLASGSVSAPDKTQLAYLVSTRTGMSQADAQARVDQVLAQIEAGKLKAKEKADAARKAALKLSLMTCLSLIIGAFIASAAATLGGKQRDV